MLMVHIWQQTIQKENIGQSKVIIINSRKIGNWNKWKKDEQTFDWIIINEIQSR